MSSPQLLIHLVVQCALVLVVAHAFGWLAWRIGQPSVVGMMVAGVCLGPSILGWVSPAIQTWCFPGEALGVLRGCAQVGVGLYLFATGLEFDLDQLAGRTRAAVAISLAGTLVPFLLGLPLAFFLAGVPGLFPDEVTLWQRGLFLGAAIAITAFPMMVWIVRERGIAGTPLGVLAIASGASGDALAWCVLALVVSSLEGDASRVTLALVGASLLGLGCLRWGRRTLSLISGPAELAGRVQPLDVLRIATVLAGFLAFSEWIGLHAVFGGFLCGLCLPRGVLNRWLRERLDPLVGPWLLPFFFTFSGLSTRLDLVWSPTGLAVLAVVLVAAVAGKGVACWGAARLSGLDPASSLGLGALMNARGLMELILLGIGLSAGIVGPLLFSVLVLMAIVTTFAATPAFEWAMRRPR